MFPRDLSLLVRHWAPTVRNISVWVSHSRKQGPRESLPAHLWLRGRSGFLINAVKLASSLLSDPPRNTPAGVICVHSRGDMHGGLASCCPFLLSSGKPGCLTHPVLAEHRDRRLVGAHLKHAPRDLRGRRWSADHWCTDLVFVLGTVESVRGTVAGT